MVKVLESWFEEGLRFVEHDILPVAGLALNFIPAVPKVVPAILSKMPELIATAEKMFPGSGKGGLKQDFFMKTAELVAADVESLSTGGQAGTWKALQPKIEPILSMAITAINRFRPGTFDCEAADDGAALSVERRQEDEMRREEDRGLSR